MKPETIIQNTFHSESVPLERLIPGIHGLRGIAALAVVLFHIVHIAKIPVPPSFAFIASDFGKGVHLFFVLSAFSLMHSTEYTIDRQNWVNQYFIKRFFRIAPLFYLTLLGTCLWSTVFRQNPWSDLSTLLLNITFTFGLAPWSGIVWAGWTVGVEMLFYVTLPIILLTVRTTKATFVLVLISVVISLASQSVLSEHYQHTVPKYQQNWAYFSFPTNLCYFILGIYAFRLAYRAQNQSLALRWAFPAFSTSLLGALLLLPVEHPLKSWSEAPILWGIAFAALCVWQSKHPAKWCANVFFQHVGERSYSVYLLHPVLIFLAIKPIQYIYNALTEYLGTYAFFVSALFVLLPLLVFAEITYRLIELPGIRMGRKLSTRTPSLTAANT